MSFQIEVGVINSFSLNGCGGNPAGVVLDQSVAAKGPESMQKIALLAGFSETVFLQELVGNKARIRFFTPTSEIDFCGHATLAIFSALQNADLFTVQSMEFLTNAGNIEVRLDSENRILMTQPLPEFGPTFDPEEVALIAGVSPADILFKANFPVQIVSTGVRDLFLPLKNEAALANMKPDFVALSGLNKKSETVGLHAFFLESNDGILRAGCRNFAPLYGIDEESATGSANGALACYLFKHHEKKPQKFCFKQGMFMGMTSEIHACVIQDTGEIKEILVGGYCSVSKAKRILI